MVTKLMDVKGKRLSYVGFRKDLLLPILSILQMSRAQILNPEWGHAPITKDDVNVLYVVAWILY